MRPSKCADALAHAETEASRANGAVRAAEGRRMDARRRFAAFHRTNMSRSRVLQGLLLYLVSQTKESPPFSLYCFSPYKAVAAPRCRTSPSLWPGGAPLSPGRSVSRTRTRPLPHHRPTRIIVEHVTSGRCRFEAMSFAKPFARQISAARRLSENFVFLTLLILVNEPLLCDPSFHKTRTPASYDVRERPVY